MPPTAFKASKMSSNLDATFAQVLPDCHQELEHHLEVTARIRKADAAIAALMEGVPLDDQEPIEVPSSHATDTVHFFSLPGELRNRIYQLVLPMCTEHINPHFQNPTNPYRPRQPALLQVCKHLRGATAPLFYGNNKFDYNFSEHPYDREAFDSVAHWLRCLRGVPLKHIRVLRFSLGLRIVRRPDGGYWAVPSRPADYMYDSVDVHYMLTLTKEAIRKQIMSLAFFMRGRKKKHDVQRLFQDTKEELQKLLEIVWEGGSPATNIRTIWSVDMLWDGEETTRFEV